MFFIDKRLLGVWPRIKRAMQIYVERVKCRLGRGSLPICISTRLLSDARTTRLRYRSRYRILFRIIEEKREREREREEIKRRGIKKRIIAIATPTFSSSSSFSILVDYFFPIRKFRRKLHVYNLSVQVSCSISIIAR